jgi:hypothetical protein
MRIFKNTWFLHFAQKQSIDDEKLKDIAKQLENGQFDADLGGGVFKQRVAIPGGGKSGGYRIIILNKKEALTFFVYGFAKANQENIKPKELKDFKKLAKYLFVMTDKQLELELKAGRFQEIQGA